MYKNLVYTLLYSQFFNLEKKGKVIVKEKNSVIPR